MLESVLTQWTVQNTQMSKNVSERTIILPCLTTYSFYHYTELFILCIYEHTLFCCFLLPSLSVATQFFAEQADMSQLPTAKQSDMVSGGVIKVNKETLHLCTPNGQNIRYPQI